MLPETSGLTEGPSEIPAGAYHDLLNQAQGMNALIFFQASCVFPQPVKPNGQSSAWEIIEGLDMKVIVFSS